jgi:hypothetical protein
MAPLRAALLGVFAAAVAAAAAAALVDPVPSAPPAASASDLCVFVDALPRRRGADAWGARHLTGCARAGATCPWWRASSSLWTRASRAA